METSPGRIYTVRPERELVPPGAAPASFRGYPTFLHGLAVAFSHFGVAYVHDLTDGRARVYATGAPAFLLSDRPGLVVDRSRPTGITRSRFTKLRRPQWLVDDEPLGARRRLDEDRYLAAWIARSGALQEDDDFSQLVMALSELRPHETYTSRADGDFREGSVNVAPWSSRKGFTVPAAAELGPVLQQSAALPPIHLVLARLAINSVEHPMQTMMTLVHEATHVRHKELTYRLFARWRTLPDRIRAKLGFRSWLEARHGRQQLALEDYKVADFEYRGSSRLSEVLAHSESFMTGYHHLPVAENPTALAFFDLEAIDSFYWGQPGEAARLDAKMEPVIIARVARYANALDPARRNALGAHLRSAAIANDFRRRLFDALGESR